ncbi:MAG TPA: serine hydrolase domain-containing protein [Fimbriimonadaceae bacterium]|nr:serine hydrolase domain-containing protein [Fimbriimonadaceae bacterium]
MRSCCRFLLLAVCLPYLAAADKVDELMKVEMRRQNIPGAVVLITKDDKQVKKAAYGLADLELGVKTKADMVFESGSIGKTFTATVIMQLWEQGKIKLDDPLSKYVDGMPDTWKEITITNLLSHTSGLPDYALVPGLGLIEQWTLQDWMAKMTKLPLDFPTGKGFGYSNSNYLLLGVIAEKITGKTIIDLRGAGIFKPLGMDHTYTADDQIVPERARGYWPGEHGLVNGPAIVGLWGDGGEMNTCEDLAKFEKGFREAKLLKPATVAMMQTSCKLPNGRKTHYGFGWFDRTVNGHEFISHGGNTGGFGCSMTRIPEKHLTIIVMTNQAMVSGDSLAQKIAFAYDPDLGPKPLVESADPDPELSAKLKAALIGLANGDTKQEILDPEYVASLATGRGQMMLPQFAQLKQIASFSYCQTETDDPDRIIRYRAKTKDHTYIAGFLVTKEGKVFAVSVRLEK